jgi:hypothetical protein
MDAYLRDRHIGIIPAFYFLRFSQKNRLSLIIAAYELCGDSAEQVCICNSDTCHPVIPLRDSGVILPHGRMGDCACVIG